jgi:N utilization substance protein B
MSEPIPSAASAPSSTEPALASPRAKVALRPQAGLRREGREAAIQFLFHLDFQNTTTSSLPQAPLVTGPVPDGDFWKLRAGGEDTEELSPMPSRAPIAPKARAFAESLIQGVWTHRDELDELITKFSRNYQLSRLAAVDRNILRLAVYEILYNNEVPPVVAINEAIELAKEYGSEESGRFVNGLLDRIRAESPRAPRQAVRNKPEA